MGTLGKRLHYRGFSRQAENTNIQKTADGRAENKSKKVQKHELFPVYLLKFVILVL